MNKFEKEKQIIFNHRGLSNDKKNAVLQAVAQKKQKPTFHWKPAFALIGVLSLAFVIWSNISKEEAIRNAYTEQSMEQAYFDMYAEDGFPGEVKYVELGKYADNDGILITLDGTEDDPFFVLYYGKYIDHKWHMQGNTGFRPYNEEQLNPYETLRNFEMTENYHFDTTQYTLFVGAFNQNTAPSKVVVGTEEVDYINVKGLPTIWFEKVKSEGTPVYFIEGTDKKLMRPFDVVERNPLELVEVNETDIVIEGSSDMLGAYDTFTDYPLVVDPLAFSENPVKIGDVVHLKNGKLARIIVADQNNSPSLQVTLTEGSILTNGYYVSLPFMNAHFNGDNTIYDRSEDRTYELASGEFFAKADNWSNEAAFEGVITQDDIVGLVKGYSLMSVKENWPASIEQTANNFRSNYDDRVLANLEALDVFILQKYAEYTGDYRLMYELYAESTMPLSYEEFLATTNVTPIKSYKQRILYNVDRLTRSGSFEEKNGALKTVHTVTKQESTLGTMVRENDVWKVRFETVVDISK